MPFLSLTLNNFRNLKNESINLSDKEIFFCGQNGQGKSNLLEALYYSSYASSFRTHNDNEIIKNGENSFNVRSLYSEENGVTHSTSISVLKNEKLSKKIEKDGKYIKDRKELINTMPCILYSHDDMDFVIGEPEKRRFFIDQSLSMYDVLYIDLMRKYKRILKNRNICLKNEDYNLLETYNYQLALNGLEIQDKRKKAIFYFNQIFGKIYEEITGIDGVSIKYLPSWHNEENLPNLDFVIDNIKSKFEAERVMKTTISGPHRDRIFFVRKNENFVPKASTGQRRLLALLLRNSQAIYYNQISGKKPVLLMDDVLLELDPEKRKNITEKLPPYDQLICTFLTEEPYQRYINSSTKVFKIENGEWSLLDERTI